MAQFDVSQLSSWEQDEPWNLSREDHEAQRYPGFVFSRQRHSETAHYTGGTIHLTPEFFDWPEGTRRAICYHEAGHAIMVSLGGVSALDGITGYDPFDLAELPGASILGYNAEEVIAEGFSVLMVEPSWLHQYPEIEGAVTKVVRAAGFPLSLSAASSLSPYSGQEAVPSGSAHGTHETGLSHILGNTSHNVDTPPPLEPCTAAGMGDWYHSVSQEWRRNNDVGTSSLPALEALLIRILKAEGVPNAENSYVQDHPGESFSAIGFDFGTIPVTGFVAICPGMVDTFTLIHEAAHLIERHRSGRWARNASSPADAHNMVWARTFLELLEQWSSPALVAHMKRGWNEAMGFQAFSSLNNVEARSSMMLYRGLHFGEADEAYIREAFSTTSGCEALIREHIDSSLGWHWSSESGPAENFALDRDWDGWAQSDPSPGNVLWGIMIEADVPGSSIHRHPHEDDEPEYWEADGVFDHDHPEAEVPVVEGAPVNVRRVWLMAVTEDGDQFDALLNSPGSVPRTASLPADSDRWMSGNCGQFAVARTSKTAFQFPGITLFHGTVGYYANKILAEGLSPRTETGVTNHWNGDAMSWDGLVYMSLSNRLTISRRAFEEARKNVYEMKYGAEEARIEEAYEEAKADLWEELTGHRPYKSGGSYNIDSYGKDQAVKDAYFEGIKGMRTKYSLQREVEDTDPDLQPALLKVTLTPDMWENLTYDEDTRMTAVPTVEQLAERGQSFPEWMGSLGADSVVAYRGTVPASKISLVPGLPQGWNVPGMLPDSHRRSSRTAGLNGSMNGWVFYNSAEDTLTFANSQTEVQAPFISGGWSAVDGAMFRFEGSDIWVTQGNGSSGISSNAWHPMAIRGLERLMDTYPEVGRMTLHVTQPVNGHGGWVDIPEEERTPGGFVRRQLPNPTGWADVGDTYSVWQWLSGVNHMRAGASKTATHQPRLWTLEPLDGDVWWHGSASGHLGTGNSHAGVHVGTKEAATIALCARIGWPVEGTWDGTRRYGETLLCGRDSLSERGTYPTGYSSRAPEDDHFPSGAASFGDGSPIPMSVYPDIFPVEITGYMDEDVHDDFEINDQIAEHGIDQGYLYENIAEDVGSVSAVVPAEYLTRLSSKTASIPQDVMDELLDALQGPGPSSGSGWMSDIPEPDYSDFDWEGHLRKIKRVYRGLSIDLSPEDYEWIQSPDAGGMGGKNQVAEWLLDQVNRANRPGVGIHWSAHRGEAAGFANMTSRRGGLRVILTADTPRLSDINTNPDKSLRYMGPTSGEEELLVNPGAQMNITRVEWAMGEGFSMLRSDDGGGWVGASPNGPRAVSAKLASAPAFSLTASDKGSLKSTGTSVATGALQRNATADGIVFDHVVDGDRWTVLKLDGGMRFILRVHDSPESLVAIGLDPNEPSFYGMGYLFVKNDGNGPYVDDIHIDAGYQRQGWGTRLFEIANIFHANRLGHSDPVDMTPAGLEWSKTVGRVPQEGERSGSFYNPLFGSRTASSFILDFPEITAQGAELWVVDHGEYLCLSSVKVPSERRGQGLATKAVRAVMQRAQESAKAVTLTPEPYDNGDSPMSKAALTRWYESLGFVRNKGQNKLWASRDTHVWYPPNTSRFGVAQASAQTPTRVVRGFKVNLPQWDRALAEALRSGSATPQQVISLALSEHGRAGLHWGTLSGPNADWDIATSEEYAYVEETPDKWLDDDYDDGIYGEVGVVLVGTMPFDPMEDNPDAYGWSHEVADGTPVVVDEVRYFANQSMGWQTLSVPRITVNASVDNYGGGHQPHQGDAGIWELDKMFPDDVYTSPHYYDHGGGNAYDRESAQVILEVRGNPSAMVDIYRSVPPNIEGAFEFDTGNWVAVAQSYADMHGEMRGYEWYDPDVVWESEYFEGENTGRWETVETNWVTMHARVPASTLRSGGNDIIEYGYWGPKIPGRIVSGRAAPDAHRKGRPS